jgi:hypothetical protein
MGSDAVDPWAIAFEPVGVWNLGDPVHPSKMQLWP